MKSYMRISTIILLFCMCNVCFSQTIITSDKYLKEACKDFIKEAKNGNAEEQYALGIACLNGNTLFKKESSVGLFWIKKAKENHYAKACELLGDCEDNKELAIHDYQDAIKYYKSSDRYQVNVNNVKLKIKFYSFGDVTQNSIDRSNLFRTLFYSGDYERCSSIGDTIENIDNLFDAIALAYSTLSNRQLKFSEASFTDRNIPQNGIRESIKSEEAIDYLVENEPLLDQQLQNDQDYSSFYFEYLQVAIECSKIKNDQRSKLHYLTIFHRLFCDNRTTQLNTRDEAAVLYYKTEYDMIYANEDSINNDICEFEQYVKRTINLNRHSRLLILHVYYRFSQLINDYVMGLEHENQKLWGIALNVMIHCRDFSLVAQKKHPTSMAFISWKSIQEKLKEDELAIAYFTNTNGNDSWNYGWMFDKDSNQIRLAYLGHSYWSEKQATEDIERNKTYQVYKKIYIVGTSSMNQLDCSNNAKLVRLYSLSEIGHNYFYNRGEKVLAIADVDFSQQEGPYSESKGSEFIGKFVNAEQEVKYLKSLFKQDITLIRKTNFGKSTFQNVRAKILHISTHGRFDKKDLDELNDSNPDDGITGDNILKSCELILSGYLDDEDNYITAYEIRDFDFKNVDLVFLSACETGKGRVLLNGDYSILSAFHVAGAKNVIAVIDPINSNIANKFGEEFYKLVIRGESYHSAFYKAKSVVCPNNRIILIE